MTVASFSRASAAISTRALVRPVWEMRTTTSPSLLLMQLMRIMTMSSKLTTGMLKRKNLFWASRATAEEAPRPKKLIFLDWVRISTQRLMAEMSRLFLAASRQAMVDSKILAV